MALLQEYGAGAGTGVSEDPDDHYQTKVSGECSWLYAGGDQEVPGVRG